MVFLQVCLFISGGSILESTESQFQLLLHLLVRLRPSIQPLNAKSKIDVSQCFCWSARCWASMVDTLPLLVSVLEIYVSTWSNFPSRYFRCSSCLSGASPASFNTDGPVLHGLGFSLQCEVFSQTLLDFFLIDFLGN